MHRRSRATLQPPMSMRRSKSQTFRPIRFSRVDGDVSDVQLERKLLVKSSDQEKEIDRLNLKLEESREDVGYWKHLYEDLYQRHTTELDELRERLNQERNENFQKEVILRDVASESIRVESQLQYSKTVAQTLQNDIEQLRGDRYRQSEEDLDNFFQLHELALEVDHLREQVDTLETQLADSNLKHEAVLRNFYDTRDAYQLSQRQVALLQDENQRLTDQINDYRSRRRSTDFTIKDVWDIQGRSRTSRSTADMEIFSHKQRRTMSENLMERINEMNDEIQDLSSQWDDATEIIRRGLYQLEAIMKGENRLDVEEVYQICFHMRRLVGEGDLPPMPLTNKSATEFSFNLQDSLQRAIDDEMSDTNASFDASRLTAGMSFATPHLANHRISFSEARLTPDPVTAAKTLQARHAVVSFFQCYSQETNWEVLAEDHRYFKMKFNDGSPIKARVAFLFSMITLVGHVVGLRRRTFSYGMFLVWRSHDSKIQWLVDTFASIRTALRFHDDDRIFLFLFELLDTLFDHHDHVASFFKSACDYDGNATAPEDDRKDPEEEAAETTDATPSVGLFARLRSMSRGRQDTNTRRVADDSAMEVPTTI